MSKTRETFEKLGALGASSSSVILTINCCKQCLAIHCLAYSVYIVDDSCSVVIKTVKFQASIKTGEICVFWLHSKTIWVYWVAWSTLIQPKIGISGFQRRLWVTAVFIIWQKWTNCANWYCFYLNVYIFISFSLPVGTKVWKKVEKPQLCVSHSPTQYKKTWTFFLICILAHAATVYLCDKPPTIVELHW